MESVAESGVVVLRKRRAVEVLIPCACTSVSTSVSTQRLPAGLRRREDMLRRSASSEEQVSAVLSMGTILLPHVAHVSSIEAVGSLGQRLLGILQLPLRVRPLAFISVVAPVLVRAQLLRARLQEVVLLERVLRGRAPLARQALVEDGHGLHVFMPVDNARR